METKVKKDEVTNANEVKVKSKRGRKPKNLSENIENFNTKSETNDDMLSDTKIDSDFDYLENGFEDEKRQEFIENLYDENEDIDYKSVSKKSKTGKYMKSSSINENFILETKYFNDVDIAKCIHDLKTKCRLAKLPMFVIIETPNGKVEADFLTAIELNIKQNEHSKVADHIKLLNGFHVTKDAQDIQIDDISL